MKNFFSELANRNKLLYVFGWYNFLCGIICIILIPFDTVQILGISRWIKPMKFFFSVAIMEWTMAWLMYYLSAQRKVRACSWLIVILMFIENFIITVQSGRGTTSHFNFTNSMNAILFGIMGMAIALFTLTIIYILFLFFLQKQFTISTKYLWGIRLGILFFIIFSAEGGMMLANAGHTVGAADGSEGLPFVNWSRGYGDLRVAHFFGMHALQLLPVLSYYFARTKTQVIIFGALYFLLVSLFFIEAMYRLPFIG